MSYTYDYILKNQDKIQHNGLKNQTEYFKRQLEINAINNQNRIILDFKHCKAFLKYNRIEEFYHRIPHGRGLDDEWKKKQQLWMIAQEGNHQLEKQIKNYKPEEITFEDLEPYIKHLSWHMSADMAVHMTKMGEPLECLYPTRWGHERHFLDREDSREKWEKIINEVERGYELLKLDDSEILDTEYMYHPILGFAWSLIQVGLGEVALWAITPLYKMWEREIEGKSMISILCNALFQDYRLRILGTLTWIKAFSHKQMGEDELYYQSLLRYVKYWENHSLDHYNVNNRVLEAAILVYKHKPSPEERIKLLNLYHHTASLFMDEPTECTRERGLVCFDLIQTLFKDEYEKYNS